jgi:hypothetical protein
VTLLNLLAASLPELSPETAFRGGRCLALAVFWRGCVHQAFQVCCKCKHRGSRARQRYDPKVLTRGPASSVRCIDFLSSLQSLASLFLRAVGTVRSPFASISFLSAFSGYLLSSHHPRLLDSSVPLVAKMTTKHIKLYRISMSPNKPNTFPLEKTTPNTFKFTLEVVLIRFASPATSVPLISFHHIVFAADTNKRIRCTVLPFHLLLCPTFFYTFVIIKSAF